MRGRCHGSGVLRGPLLFRPGCRRTTDQRRGLHPGGTGFFLSGGAVRFYQGGRRPRFRATAAPAFPASTLIPYAVTIIPAAGRRPMPGFRAAAPVLPFRLTPRPDQATGTAAAVRSWMMPRLRCHGRQARLASFLCSHVEVRSAVAARMTVRRLSLSPSVGLSVRRWKGIAGTG